MSLSSTWPFTDCTSITARVILYSFISFFGPRAIFSVTAELIGPRILSTA